LETQAISQLRFGLRIAQAVKMLQQHDAQQDGGSMTRPPQFAVGRLQPSLGLGKID
jgi:hypothetical protein